MALYQYPSDLSGYALRAGGNYYSTRRSGGVLGIVLHITAGLQDLGMSGDDPSAEGTARWANNPDKSVSWHVGVDSDSIVPCLPDTYTAWHAAGYNSRTFGIEISKLDVDWSDMPAAWVTATLGNAARALAPIVKKYNLPLVRATKAQVDSAQAAGRPFGFTYHSYTSAGTRSDPGSNFPFDRLMSMIRDELAGTTTQEEDDMPTLPEIASAVWAAEFGPSGARVTAGTMLARANGAATAALEAATAAARDAAVARALAEAAAQNPDTLSAAEVDAIGERVGAEFDERFTVTVQPTTEVQS